MYTKYLEQVILDSQVFPRLERERCADLYTSADQTSAYIIGKFCNVWRNLTFLSALLRRPTPDGIIKSGSEDSNKNDFFFYEGYNKNLQTFKE